MERPRTLMILRLGVAACLVTLAVWLAAINLSPKQNAPSLNMPVASQNLPGAKPTIPQGVPVAVATDEPTAIPYPPTWTPAPSTPTPAVLQAATLITPSQVSNLTLDLSNVLTEKGSGNSAEPIRVMVWAPTGDKLVYVTGSGNLYYSNTDGTSATLLHSYNSDQSWSLLDEQMPLTNTLLVPGYAIHFTLGQPPVLQSAPDTLRVTHIRWWSPNRASGVVSGEFEGGEKLVTLDSNGQLVEERNIPYMASGVVQPRGNWLAYSTEYHRAYYGPNPGTIYLFPP